MRLSEQRSVLRTALTPYLLSSARLVERAAVHRPRSIIHGAVAVVGLGVVVAATAAEPAHPAPAATEQSPALVDLPMQELVVPADSRPGVAAAVETDSETATPPAPPAPKPAKPQVHTVAEGETIRMLAARYGVEPLTILAANSLRDPDLLEVGQELVILPTDGVLHILHTGESIRGVAERYGVEVADIVKANDLGPDPNIVQPGADLVVPGATPVLAQPSRA
ncbi:MAG TPA: LysM domain-containing protein, partial [Chloroflexota bacterium]|nr:LysM domain-containing protein [Chloroflexota bacterium]